jgi:predicted nucleotidyltransferase component of viral defense system
MKKTNISAQMNRYEKSKISEQTKIREVLQQTALLGLERCGFFEKAAFYGGTALRILYGLDRFSEDLDFTLLKPDPSFDFIPFLEGMKKELSSVGFHMEVTKNNKTAETSIVSAFMKMNTIELYLAIGDESKTKNTVHNEKMKIKLEVDIDPPPLDRFESKLVLDPTTFYVLTLHKSDLFAGKMAAILFRVWKGRVKGRDWYDLVWYIQNKVPLSLAYLESCMKQSGNLQPSDFLTKKLLLDMLHEKIHSIDWADAKADMRSFISDPERLDIWSSSFFLNVIEHLIVE